MSTKSIPTTTGELHFRNYLEGMQYPFEFEKQFPDRSHRPDYTVTKNGVFLFDVKDFDPQMPTTGGGSYDPYTRIREKINEGGRKFKQFKEFSCSVVLQNNGNAFVHLDDVHVMLGAMYGDSGFEIPMDMERGEAVGGLRQKFLRRGKMRQPGKIQNKTISALITLRHVAVGWQLYRQMLKECPRMSMEEVLAAAEERFPNFDLNEKELAVIVWENAVARIPLPRELFTGPYDRRWGYEDGNQLIVFTGEKLAALETKKDNSSSRNS